MKRTLLLTMFFCVTGLWAQNKVANKVSELQRQNANFKSVSVLNPTQIVDNNVDKVVEGATIATVNFEKINDVVSNQYETIRLLIPYQNQNIAILLYKINPFAEGFHLDSNKSKDISYQKGMYYRGMIEGVTNSVASFNFFNGEFNGIFSSSELGNVVVGKLQKKGNQREYIVYSDAKMKVLNGFDCHFKDDEFPVKNNANANRDGNSLKNVSLYFEVDNNLFLANGSSLTATTNWMTSVFNNVQTLYANDGITVSLRSIFIWEDFDPYEGVGTTSGAYLQAFSQNTPVFDGDLGQLIGIDEGGLGGVAVSIGGTCTEGNYSYSDLNFEYSTVPTFSWTVFVITHEFGHLLGSRHTHACVWNGNNTSIDGCGTQAGYTEGNCPTGPIPTDTKGTIMSYCHLISGVGTNFNNGFGPQPTQAILNSINSGECLGTDASTSCPNTVIDIKAINVTATSATITWTDFGSAATSWQVAVTPFASTDIVWNTATTNSYSVSGLNANQYYIIRVRPICPGLVTASRQKIFAAAVPDFCVTTQFTDTGGTTGNYTNMESWTRTMTPNNPGLKLRISFSSFNIEEGFDYLYIFDGPDDTYQEITGGLTGEIVAGRFDSTAADGSLTVKFVSDPGVVGPGWNAVIACTGTMGVEDADFLDYSYAPNPTTGNVAIKSKDAITEVAVYNVQGQLLYNKKINDLAANVDISQFAKGTYFFKMKINDKEAHFKIVKM